MMDFEKQVSEFRAGSHFFARGRPVFIGRSPGRLDLMGGNVDYTGGLVFEATIREATWAAVPRMSWASSTCCGSAILRR
jgi:L-arabinokinase